MAAVVNTATGRGGAFIMIADALLLTTAPLPGLPQEDAVRAPVISERTPSRAYYFDWLNSQYEGSTETHSLINLEFFHWLHDEYGMELDVYLLDVGNIDDGEYWNVEAENYTFFFPLTSELVGKEIEAVLLGFEGGGAELEPRIWVTAYPKPLVSRELILYEAR